MTSNELRQAFLDYFVSRDHRLVRSHALVPPNDPTLYFVNAGMVQFKDLFVGAREADYTRATSCQKCLRVSGKHNDLENVGRTARHHTLFEMLGNFSFGDYFKRDAIRFGWEFLTQVIELDPSTLHATVYPDDEEAYAIWRDEIGLPLDQLHRDPENFWAMGDTGPCGPCSEIHIDQGPALSGGREVPFGDPAGDDRYLELWNLVFMQYERKADGTMTPLPRPSIDTGAGLERIAAVLQGKVNNFDTDLFLPIIEQVSAKAGVRLGDDPETDVALRVIADHSRAAAFLVADGIYPDNDGRGYVLRRIMRRAVRFGRIIGLEDPFLVDTTATVIDMMGEFYPELVEGRDTVHRIVLQEEKRFGRTINAGMKRLADELSRLSEQGKTVLDGRVAFELYDTHGFPPDLTELICSEKGVHVDQAGFDEGMREQRERARAASRFGSGDLSSYRALADEGIQVEFVGYEREQEQATVRALLVEGERVPRAAAGQHVEVVVERTPFYAESGGQAGDVGTMRTEAGDVLRVEDVQKPFGDVIVHVGIVDRGSIREGDQVTLEVDHAAREATRRNHSATHLLHGALRAVLGDHVRQRGSLVAPDRLRFDFSHTSGMTSEEEVAVEERVNGWIVDNEPIITEVLPLDDAIAAGAIAFFEEKYGDAVRMLRVGSSSTELCGGTHARATGDIGFFKIVSEGAISAGIRRVEAVTGMNALRWVQEHVALLDSAAEALRVGPQQVPGRIDGLLAEKKSLTSELADTKVALRTAEAATSLSKTEEIDGLKVGVVRLDGIPGKELRALAESLKDRLGKSGVLLLGATDDEKVSLVVAVMGDATAKLHAGKLVGQLAPMVGGRGGGRPDLAQAGGSDAAGLDGALEAFRDLVRGQLGS